MRTHSGSGAFDVSRALPDGARGYRRTVAKGPTAKPPSAAFVATTSGAPSRTRVLVVDDEPAVREALQSCLTFEGYDVLLAPDGVAALDVVREQPPDLVVLDLLMPRLDGLSTCRRLRASGETVPVLMLTARDAVGDRVAGLDVGADDYLGKPFALNELLARIRALLRRTARPGTGSTDTLRFDDLRMDRATRDVTRGEQPLELTRTEFTLLELFLTHPCKVLTREAILRHVWGFDFEPASNSLDVYMMYLRRKTEIGGAPRLLHTVRGVGFVLRAPDRP